MFDKILYPTDFSDVSKKGLDYIKQLKNVGAGRIVVLHVIDERGVEAADRYSLKSVAALEERMRDDAMQSMRPIEEEPKQSGFDVETRVKIGIPLREILDAEKAEDISVIVIGSHGKSNLEEIFLGSVSEKVIRRCKKPVLVIKR